MKILSFINKNSGVSYHRLIMPLLLMPDVDVFITNDLREEHFEGVDMFIYNRTLPDHAMATVHALQAKHGFRIAVDIDDYWELDEHHILYHTYQSEGFAARQIEHIKNADVILTTHERLADLIKPYNRAVHICPNAIPHQGQYAIERIHSDYVRLFWQGSDTHREDIALLSSAMERLGQVARRIKMIMSGYAEDHEEWQQMVLDYTADLKHQYKLIPYAPVSRYYDAYKEADVCLIPLVNSPFNRMKSNLKVLEAANLALPCIVSNVHPYKGMPVLYASCPQDWVNNIKRLVSNPRMREDVGGKLKAWCDREYNFQKINEHRKEVLEYVCKKVSV